MVRLSGLLLCVAAALALPFLARARGALLLRCPEFGYDVV